MDHLVQQELLFAAARKASQKDGRLRYVLGRRITLRKPKGGDFYCIGPVDWAIIRDGRWEAAQPYEN